MPDGQISKRPYANQQSLSSPSRKNISLEPSGKSVLELFPSTPKEGRIAIVTNAGLDAVDAAALGANVIAGRAFVRERSNGVLTIDVAVDGEVVWF